MPSRGYFENVLGLDTRSLAVFRFTLAVNAIADLIQRWQWLVPHYTDVGIYKRSFVLEQSVSSIRDSTSIHMIGGGPFYMHAIFSIHLLLLLFFLVGYRIRLISILTWYFSYSLLNRNQNIINAGDAAQVQLFFFAMFLPIGHSWSIDEAFSSKTDLTKKRSKDYFVLSVATPIIWFFYWIIYGVGYFFKYGKHWNDTLMALWIALSEGYRSTHLGRILRSFPLPILKAMTYVVVRLEYLIGFLYIMPFYTNVCKTAASFGYALMQLVFGACLALGPFTFIALPNLANLPSYFWDEILLPRLKTPFRLGLTVRYNPYCLENDALVRIFATFFLITETKYSHINDGSSKLIETIDYKGNRKHNAEAVLVLLEASPLLYPLRHVFRFVPFYSLLSKFFKTFKAERISIEEEESITRKPLRFSSVGEKINSKLKPKFYRLRSILFNLFFPFLYVLMIWHNVNKINLQNQIENQTAESIIFTIGLGQGWSMYAPDPKDYGRFPFHIATLSNGSKVDLLKNGGFHNGFHITDEPWILDELEVPDSPADMMRVVGSVRWETTLMMRGTKSPEVTRQLADYECRMFNRNLPKGYPKIVSIKNIVVSIYSDPNKYEEVMREGPEIDEVLVYWNYDCPKNYWDEPYYYSQMKHLRGKPPDPLHNLLSPNNKP